jgi:hypothetical protein
MAEKTSMLWTDLEICIECKGVLTKTPGGNRDHTAHILNGNEWTEIQHGTKICEECGLRYKLNYVVKDNTKQNIVRATDKNPTILTHGQLGFTYNYLVQLWHRICRTGTSPGAEASVILLTAIPEHKRTRGPTTKTDSMTEDSLSRQLTRAIFVFLRLQEQVYDFNVDDPVPSGDHVFD